MFFDDSCFFFSFFFFSFLFFFFQAEDGIRDWSVTGVQTCALPISSIMMAGTGDGKLLPPYIVYKSIYLHDIWCNGGPPGCRFNTSKSGWFDQKCFEDWFESVALRYLKDLPGKKVIIGDNLSSHLSVNVITKCEENNISLDRKSTRLNSSH